MLRPSEKRYLFNIALSIAMLAVLLYFAHLQGSGVPVWIFVFIHIVEVSGHFYFKKNVHLNAFWFRRVIIGAKILFLIGCRILRRHTLFGA